MTRTINPSSTSAASAAAMASALTVMMRVEVAVRLRRLLEPIEGRPQRRRDGEPIGRGGVGRFVG